MADMVGPGNTSGEQSPSLSLPPRSFADAAVTIAGIAAVVALAFHKDVTAPEALAAIAAAMVPETSPFSFVKRLAARFLPKEK
jgi:hypothetical protein